MICCSKINISQFLCVCCELRSEKETAISDDDILYFELFSIFSCGRKKEIKLESMMIVSAAESYDAFNVSTAYNNNFAAFSSLCMINAECVCVYVTLSVWVCTHVSV